MKKFVFVLIALAVTMVGCHSGKSAAERHAEKRAKFVADSIAKETIQFDFEKGEFLFKVERIENRRVNPADSWILFYRDEIRMQTVSYVAAGNGVRNLRVGKINSLKKEVDPKKGTITLSGNSVLTEAPYDKIAVTFTFTLYAGSNKGYGFIGNSSCCTYDGHFEPITDSDISTFVPITLKNLQ